MAAATAATCPRCDGDMWDNTQSKRSSTSPDFRCKNSSCGGAIWLDGRGPRRAGRAPTRAAAATNGNGREREAAPPAPASQDGDDRDPQFYAAWRLYRQSLAAVLAHTIPKLQESGLKPTAADALAATATLFIQSVRGR